MAKTPRLVAGGLAFRGHDMAIQKPWQFNPTLIIEDRTALHLHDCHVMPQRAVV
jgi:hypothetical protein